MIINDDNDDDDDDDDGDNDDDTILYNYKSILSVSRAHDDESTKDEHLD